MPIRCVRIVMAISDHEAAVSTLNHNQVNAVPEVFGLFARQARLQWCPLPHTAALLACDGDEAEITYGGAIGPRVSINNDDTQSAACAGQCRGQPHDSGTDDGKVETARVVESLLGGSRLYHASRSLRLYDDMYMETIATVMRLSHFAVWACAE